MHSPVNIRFTTVLCIISMIVNTDLLTLYLTKYVGMFIHYWHTKFLCLTLLFHYLLQSNRKLKIIFSPGHLLGILHSVKILPFRNMHVSEIFYRALCEVVKVNGAVTLNMCTFSMLLRGVHWCSVCTKFRKKKKNWFKNWDRRMLCAKVHYTWHIYALEVWLITILQIICSTNSLFEPPYSVYHCSVHLRMHVCHYFSQRKGTRYCFSMSSFFYTVEGFNPV